MHIRNIQVIKTCFVAVLTLPFCHFITTVTVLWHRHDFTFLV